jgi:hypothetical protein
MSDDKPFEAREEKSDTPIPLTMDLMEKAYLQRMADHWEITVIMPVTTCNYTPCKRNDAGRCGKTTCHITLPGLMCLDMERPTGTLFPMLEPNPPIDWARQSPLNRANNSGICGLHSSTCGCLHTSGICSLDNKPCYNIPGYKP